MIKNIRTVVYDLKVDRIGHAIGLPYDRELMTRVIDKHIKVEGCPGSNFASGLIPDVLCLKIREMLEGGVIYSINPDDDIFLLSMDETFAMCDKAYRFKPREIETLRENAWKSIFGNRKYRPAV